MSAPDLTSRYLHIREHILALEQNYHRPKQSVTLLAVSKKQSIEAISKLAHAGQKHFAENYLQEAVPKILALASADITWHFIGTVQTNKAKLISQHFDWVHTIRRQKDIEYLAKYRPADKPPLQICIQLKLDDAETKGGASEPIESLLECANQHANIQCRGLMGFPAPADHFEQQCHQFKNIRQTFADLQQHYPLLDTLCIGTSQDYAAAIKMNATMIRLGTVLFGQREG